MSDNNALRLADTLDRDPADITGHKAAAELRRLHEQLEKKSDAIQKLWKERDELRAENEQLRAQNTELDAACARLETENEALRADAARYRWLMAHPLWHVGYRVKRNKQGNDYREYRMLDEGDYWGQWWPTPEQAIDFAMGEQK